MLKAITTLGAMIGAAIITMAALLSYTYVANRHVHEELLLQTERDNKTTAETMRLRYGKPLKIPSRKVPDLHGPMRIGKTNVL
jgi:hypothetical protein